MPDQSTPLPIRTDRKGGAEIVTRLKFPVSYRTIERWPELQWLIVNGKATTLVELLLAAADARLAAATEKQSTTTNS